MNSSGDGLLGGHNDLAEALRRLFEESDHAPEGAELWRWYWVAARVREVHLPLPSPLLLAAWTDGEVRPLDETIRITEVRPVLWCALPLESGLRRAGSGWSCEAQAVVLFMGNGGTFAHRPPASNGLAGALTEQGRAIRSRESVLALIDLIHQLRDELGLAEGEEWKREPPAGAG